MGRRFPDGGLLRYRKWVPQQLGDVNKQGSGDSRPMGARHGDTSANHTDLQSGCSRPCVFAVWVWSNLWDLIWDRTSHYSMVLVYWCWCMQPVNFWLLWRKIIYIDVLFGQKMHRNSEMGQTHDLFCFALEFRVLVYLKIILFYEMFLRFFAFLVTYCRPPRRHS